MKVLFILVFLSFLISSGSSTPGSGNDGSGTVLPLVTSLSRGWQPFQYFFSLNNTYGYAPSNLSITVGGLNCAVDAGSMQNSTAQNGVQFGTCRIQNPYMPSIPDLLSSISSSPTGSGWLVEQWKVSSNSASRFGNLTQPDAYWISPNPNIASTTAPFFLDNTEGFRLRANVRLTSNDFVGVQHVSNYNFSLACTGICSVNIIQASTNQSVTLLNVQGVTSNSLFSQIQSLLSSVSGALSLTPPMEASYVSHFIDDNWNPNSVSPTSITASGTGSFAGSCSATPNSFVKASTNSPYALSELYLIDIVYKPVNTTSLSLNTAVFYGSTYICSFPYGTGGVNFTLPDYWVKSLQAQTVGSNYPLIAQTAAFDSSNTSSAYKANSFFSNPAAGVTTSLVYNTFGVSIQANANTSGIWRAFFVPNVTAYYHFRLSYSGSLNANLSIQLSSSQIYYIDYAPRALPCGNSSNNNTGDATGYRWFKLYVGKIYLLKLSYYADRAAGSATLVYNQTASSSSNAPSAIDLKPLPLALLRNVVSGTGANPLPAFTYTSLPNTLLNYSSSFNPIISPVSAQITDVVSNSSSWKIVGNFTKGVNYSLWFTPDIQNGMQYQRQSTVFAAGDNEVASGELTVSMPTNVEGVQMLNISVSACIATNICFTAPWTFYKPNPLQCRLTNAVWRTEPSGSPTLLIYGVGLPYNGSPIQRSLSFNGSSVTGYFFNYTYAEFQIDSSSWNPLRSATFLLYVSYVDGSGVSTSFSTSLTVQSYLPYLCVFGGINSVNESSSLTFNLVSPSSFALISLNCTAGSLMSFNGNTAIDFIPNKNASVVVVSNQMSSNFISKTLNISIGGMAENSRLNISYNASFASPNDFLGQVSIFLKKVESGQSLQCLINSFYSLSCQGGFYNNSESVWSMTFFGNETIELPVVSEVRQNLSTQFATVLPFPPFRRDQLMRVAVYNPNYPAAGEISSLLTFSGNNVLLSQVDDKITSSFNSNIFDPITILRLWRLTYLDQYYNGTSSVISLGTTSVQTAYSALLGYAVQLPSRICDDESPGATLNFTSEDFISFLYSLAFEFTPPYNYSRPSIGPPLYQLLSCVSGPLFNTANPNFTQNGTFVKIFHLLNGALYNVSSSVLLSSYPFLDEIVFSAVLTGAKVLQNMQQQSINGSVIQIYAQTVNNTHTVASWNTTGAGNWNWASVSTNLTAGDSPVTFFAYSANTTWLPVVSGLGTPIQGNYLRSFSTSNDQSSYVASYSISIPSGIVDFSTPNGKALLKPTLQFNLTYNPNPVCSQFDGNSSSWSSSSCNGAKFLPSQQAVACNCTSFGAVGLSYADAHSSEVTHAPAVACSKLSNLTGLVASTDFNYTCLLSLLNFQGVYDFSQANILNATLENLGLNSTVSFISQITTQSGLNISFNSNSIMLYPGLNTLSLVLKSASGASLKTKFNVTTAFPNASVINAFIDNASVAVNLTNVYYTLLSNINYWLVGLSQSDKAAVMTRTTQILNNLVSSSYNIAIPSMQTLVQNIQDSSTIQTAIAIPQMDASSANEMKTAVGSAIIANMYAASATTANNINQIQSSNTTNVNTDIMQNYAAEKQLQRLLVPVMTTIMNQASSVSQSDISLISNAFSSIIGTQESFRTALGIEPLGIQQLVNISSSFKLNFTSATQVSDNSNSYTSQSMSLKNISNGLLLNTTSEGSMWNSLIKTLESLVIRSANYNWSDYSNGNWSVNLAQSNLCLNSLAIGSSVSYNESATVDCSLLSSSTNDTQAMSSSIVNALNHTELNSLIFNSTGNSSAVGYLVALGSNPFYYANTSANIGPNVTQFSILDLNGNEVSVKNLSTCINISIVVNTSLFGSKALNMNYSTTNATYTANRTVNVVPACRYWDTDSNMWSSAGLNSSYYNSSIGIIYCCWNHLSIFGIDSVGSFSDIAPSITLSYDTSRLATLKSHPWVIAVYTVIFGVYIVGMIVLFLQQRHVKNQRYPLVAPRRYLVFIKTGDFKLFKDAIPYITLVGSHGNSPPTPLFAWHQLARVQKGNIRAFHVLSPVLGHIHEVILENRNKKNSVTWNLEGVRVIDTAHSKCYTFNTPAKNALGVDKPVKLSIPTLTKRKEPLWPKMYFACMYSLREGHRFWSVILKPTISPMSRMARLTMLLYMIMANFFLTALIYSNPVNVGQLTTKIGFAVLSWAVTTITGFILSFIWKRSSGYFKIENRAPNGSPQQNVSETSEVQPKSKIIRRGQTPAIVRSTIAEEDDKSDDDGTSDLQQSNSYTEQLSKTKISNNVNFSGSGKGLAGSQTGSNLRRAMSPSSPTSPRLPSSSEVEPPVAEELYQPFNNSTRGSEVSDTTRDSAVKADSESNAGDHTESSSVHSDKSDSFGSGLRRKMGHHLDLEEEEKKKKPFTLPGWCRYLAWFFAFGGILAFIIFSWVEVLSPAYPSIDSWLLSSVIAIFLDLVAWIPFQMIGSGLMIVFVSVFFG